MIGRIFGLLFLAAVSFLSVFFLLSGGRGGSASEAPSLYTLLGVVASAAVIWAYFTYRVSKFFFMLGVFVLLPAAFVFSYLIYYQN